MSDRSGQQIVILITICWWYSLKKLSEVEGKEQYRVEISNRFTALVNLDTELDIDTTWETIRENIKISAKESLC
jgi:hypothetical protein